jgi:siroheme synthase
VGKGETASEWLPAAMSADTVVLYMAAGAGPEIARALIGAGKSPSTPVALVESATLESERRTHTSLEALARSAATKAEGPVVVCVGEVFRDTAHELQIEPLRINEHR